MENEHYLYLVDLIREDIRKQDTNMRQSIPPEKLTCLVLRYFATGETQSLLFLVAISDLLAHNRKTPQQTDFSSHRASSYYHITYLTFQNIFSFKIQYIKFALLIQTELKQ